MWTYESYNDYLQHHGVKGQKWGVRRYQNADGSLTPAGKKRFLKKRIKELYKSKRITAIDKRLMSMIDTDGRDQKSIIDAIDEKYLSTRTVINIGSPYAKKKAGAELEAWDKAGKDWWNASDGGKIKNKKISELDRKHAEAGVIALNKLKPNLSLPSGRTYEYAVVEDKLHGGLKPGIVIK